MWNDHFYGDLTIYRSQHVGVSQPNFGVDSSGSAIAYNIRGVAPYWRFAFQELTAKTQYEIGTYGLHMNARRPAGLPVSKTT